MKCFFGRRKITHIVASIYMVKLSVCSTKCRETEMFLTLIRIIYIMGTAIRLHQVDQNMFYSPFFDSFQILHPSRAAISASLPYGRSQRLIWIQEIFTIFSFTITTVQLKNFKGHYNYWKIIDDWKLQKEKCIAIDRKLEQQCVKVHDIKVSESSVMGLVCGYSSV